MAKLSKSPERGTFQATKYIERQAEKGLTPENDQDTLAMVEFYDSWKVQAEDREKDPNWSKNNLEYDLRTCDWILNKVRNDDAYAQNLYAAMCNNEFQKIEPWLILKEDTWSCSWRYAGGIIADMQEKGDYINWYCSGIRNDLDDSVKEGWSDLERHRYETIYARYVGEGHVTAEITDDLLKLGWTVVDNDE